MRIAARTSNLRDILRDLPNLEHLDFRETEDMYPQRNLPTAANLRHLSYRIDLDMGTVQGSHLGKILRACPNLTHLCVILRPAPMLESVNALMTVLREAAHIPMNVTLLLRGFRSISYALYATPSLLFGNGTVDERFHNVVVDVRSDNYLMRQGSDITHRVPSTDQRHASIHTDGNLHAPYLSSAISNWRPRGRIELWFTVPGVGHRRAVKNPGQRTTQTLSVQESDKPSCYFAAHD